MMLKRLLVYLLSFLMAFTPPAFGAFDPVNDDTDIFLANPNIPAERPNVLIVLDNTANWNQPFTNEKNALVQVVNNLSDQFNVGLMMFPETGGGNDNVDGGYVRYHVRQMTATNKSALANLVNNLDILADKGNNATVGLALYEAYLYYAGLASVASYGKVKTDKDGTTDPLLSPLSGHALPASPTAASLYRSPIVDGCQRNFIIYISNGPANENASARSWLETRLGALTGTSPPATIAINPSGQQANWADEMAKYMANADVNTAAANTQNVYTYVVEVNPGTTGQGQDMTALLKSTASNGKGKYFGVTSDASGSGIVDALNAIFTEVQAVNSVFASTTLPVSVNVRGTNLNQVYIGVFRPDPNKSPRWLGNLKMYNLALNSATSEVYLADASAGPPPAVGIPAENTSTGFVTGNAASFWTTGSSFWGFRDPSQNGVGGASDSPDGDLVEKGGAAQKIRTAFPNAQNPVGSESLRRLYTCTANGVYTNQCAAGSRLADTPFSTTNTDIDAGALNLDTRFISPLTALHTEAVTTLTDRRPATLTNAGASIPVISLSNGATTYTITNLTTATPKIVNSLSAAVPNVQTVAISGIAKSGANYVVTAAAALPSNFVAGASVTISGNSNSAFNTVWTVGTVNTVAKTFVIPGPSGNVSGTGGTGTVTSGTVNSTTATANVTAHGFVSGQTVTMAGASPAQFNGNYSVTVTGADTFTYLITPAAGTATTAVGFTNITAAGNTTTATATTAAAHGLAAGQAVTISGASNAAYNGTKILLTASGSTFTYSVGGTAIAPNTASPVYAVRGGTTTVLVTTGGHTLTNGQLVTISGSDIAGYNGTFTISNAVSPTFEYTTSSVLPANTSAAVTASTSTISTVTATIPGHGFVPGNLIRIESTSGDTVHPGIYTVSTVAGDQVTYSTGSALAAPTGSYTARYPYTQTKAIAVTAGLHNYTVGQQITVAGANPAGYNGTFNVTRVVDPNTFEYGISGLSAPLGPNSSSAVTSSIKTTTARATSVSHGFADGSSITITGASPAVFNGTKTVTVVDANTFTYTLGSVQGDATGTITAAQAGTGGAERTALINWVRGEDNAQDENTNGLLTDIRASVHGDVLHSRPAVVNYNRFGSDNDVYIYYGGNDGVFHAVKGGYATDGADPAALPPGSEAWGFIPTEFFSQFKRMRNNSPTISSSFKKPYFMDGPIGVYTKDNDGNGRLGDAGDIVNLYVAMRRGGRFIYAMDVKDPVDPLHLWKLDNMTAGFGELGQTWSQPTVIAQGLNGYANPVLVFGAGYDPAVEDIDPTTITAVTATSVTTASGTVNRTMGRGIYVVDAVTGALVWSAGRSGSGATLEVSGMDFAIPSDVTIIKNESGGAINRAYVGDTGGNLWRIDFSGANLSTTTVTKLASIGNHAVLSSRRKFMFPPDVVAQDGFDAILLGSGDREHPFDSGVVNRMYMFKDKGTDAGPVTGTSVTDPTIVEAAMFDATSNCLQDASMCGAGGQAGAATALSAGSGWYVTLGTGEKVIGNAISIGGTTFFNTNQPSASAGGGTCGSNLGIARQYQMSTADATATVDLNASGGLTGGDRFSVAAGGGYLPSPVHVVVTLGGKPVEAVISGIQVSTPPGATLQSRLRRYWYKEIE